MNNNNNNNKLNSWAITGLMDAEGSFGVQITRDNSRKLGYVISTYVEMALNFKDKVLLEKIKAFWGVGTIYQQEESCNYIYYNWKNKNKRRKGFNPLIYVLICIVNLIAMVELISSLRGYSGVNSGLILSLPTSLLGALWSNDSGKVTSPKP